MSPPVLLLIFNRPNAARRVIAALRAVAPDKLYVAADGARNDVPGDDALCRQARQTSEEIDWDCKVQKLFRDENLGCKRAVSSAIDWFFENEEQGIILEDDCLPDPSFFRFCGEILERYRENKRIMTVNGSNFQFGRKRGHASYFFSRRAHVWGWATWRRAWKRFDLEMKTFPEFMRAGRLEKIFPDERVSRYYAILLSAAFEGRINSWAYPFLYAVLKHDGLCVSPNTNMVENTGFSGSGTHTTFEDAGWLKKIAMRATYRRYTENRAHPISFPLVHPEKIEPDTESDAHYFRTLLNNPFMWLHLRLKFGRLAALRGSSAT